MPVLKMPSVRLPAAASIKMLPWLTTTWASICMVTLLAAYTFTDWPKALASRVGA